MINTDEYELTWYKDSIRVYSIHNPISLGQIKLLYLNGYYLIDNEINKELSFKDISFMIAANAMCYY